MAQRWITLTSNLALEAASGSSYAFAVYSDQIKDICKFSQDEIQTVGSVGNIGLYLSVIAGLVYDRYGPFVTTLVGIILLTSGYIAMWAGASGKITNTVGAMSFYAFVWSNGSAWYDTVAVATNIRNFPNDRGRITGLLKSVFGLSASIITIVYSSYFKSTDAGAAIDILIFTAIMTASCGLIGLFSTKLVPPSLTIPIPDGELLFITLSMAALGLLSVYVLIIAILEDKGTFSERTDWPALVLIPIVLLQCVLLVPAFRHMRGSSGDKDTSTDDVDTHANERSPLLRQEDTDELLEGSSSTDAAHESESADSPDDSEKVVSYGSSFTDIVKDPSFWVLSMVTLFGTGAGLTMINNIAQQVKALRGRDFDKNADANLYVVVISVANCCGRLFWGFCTDKFTGINRAGWLTIVTASMTSAMAVSAFSDLNLLIFGSAWVGLSYGGYWAIMPSILADMYGTKWFAVAYSVVSLFPALGSYLLSAVLTGRLYDKNVEDGDTECYGQQCFEEAFLIISGMCLFGTALGMLLTYQTNQKNQ